MLDQEATTGALAKLGAHLRAHPENQLPSLEHVEDIVYNQRKAFPHVIANSINFTYGCFYKTVVPRVGGNCTEGANSQRL